MAIFPGMRQFGGGGQVLGMARGLVLLVRIAPPPPVVIVFCR